MQPTRYRSSAPTPRKRHAFKKLRRHIVLPVAFVVVLAALIGVGGYNLVFASNTKPKSPAPAVTAKTKPASVATTTTTPATATKPATTATPPPTTACSSNTLAQNVVVSISQQHLWACSGTTEAYDSAVVTGMELYPADLTPTGTYHIYAKETDLTLSGHDSTGSWNDPVSYWMPFLDNQYGEYGFHDATWRSASDFGNINIDNPYTAAEHGSHGCVELPLATAAWLYNWASVGTTVTIES